MNAVKKRARQLQLPVETAVAAMPLHEFAERAYLDYAMYVILDRALPHLADGLKPVQRRILYAMSELALAAPAKPKKSARTIGDVIGKYHPHGESACYEAMVLMAQDFSIRYPLVDGQGNWGSVADPKSFAATRYTEARLRPYAQLLLAEIDQGTVDWEGNFDGTLREPKLLPARLPNVLLNGACGIAVGMATDVPPHNLRETIAACLLLLDNSKAALQQILDVLPAPDLPGGAVIVSHSDELKQVYSCGNGIIRQRARWHQEKHWIVITALPHQISAARVQEQIALQRQAGKLPMLEDDLRDESDQEHPLRLILTVQRHYSDTQALMEHLFATTDLECGLRVNLNVIGLDGRPRGMGFESVVAGMAGIPACNRAQTPYIPPAAVAQKIAPGPYPAGCLCPA